MLYTPPTDKFTTVLQLVVQQICHIAVPEPNISACPDVGMWKIFVRWWWICCRPTTSCIVVSSSVGVLYNMSVAGVRVVEFGTYGQRHVDICERGIYACRSTSQRRCYRRHGGRKSYNDDLIACFWMSRDESNLSVLWPGSGNKTYRRRFVLIEPFQFYFLVFICHHVVNADFHATDISPVHRNHVERRW